MGATATAQRLFRTWQETRQKKSLQQRIRDFRGFHAMGFDSGDFRVETATNPRQLIQVLQLRHEIFIEEWQGRKELTGLDVDKYDFTADHLLIIDKRTEETIGTYRLLMSDFAPQFYSESEFDLTEFLKSPGRKLELGRACVKASRRDGHTIDLLWKGLTQYIEMTKTEFLFGCSSIKSINSASISGLYRRLHDEEYWSDDYFVRPVPDYRFPDFPAVAAPVLSVADRRELVPPLLRSYLHAGAKVYGWPALDRDFACTDLLTILDWGRLNPKFKSRYSIRG